MTLVSVILCLFEDQLLPEWQQCTSITITITITILCLFPCPLAASTGKKRKGISRLSYRCGLS
ncbi:Uncharacterized protein APZ42_023982 [Daphnia magna]|uniref:Uncharacterized protein n=1 Tax=Daphnia magna TaxID=35525 RepID=A0A0P5W2A2_9CRUS|nr:Uncharacterized protein APZ42_023982 [Daphnia magna]